MSTRGVRGFVPVRCRCVQGKRHGMHGLIPIIRGLVFIHSSLRYVRHVHRSVTLSLTIHCVFGRRLHHPVAVPSSRVHDFVTISNGCRRRVICLSPVTATLRGNSHIHIANNVFRNIRKIVVHIGKSHHISIYVRKIVTMTATCVRPSLVRHVPSSSLWLIMGRLVSGYVVFRSWVMGQGVMGGFVLLRSRVSTLYRVARRLLGLNFSNDPVCSSHFYRLGLRMCHRSRSLCVHHDSNIRRRTQLYCALLDNFRTAVCSGNGGGGGVRTLLSHD